jgi:hypothetical protein
MSVPTQPIVSNRRSKPLIIEDSGAVENPIGPGSDPTGGLRAQIFKETMATISNMLR